jgi:hypothetical protein
MGLLKLANVVAKQKKDPAPESTMFSTGVDEMAERH